MTDPSDPDIQDLPPQLVFLRRLVTTLTVVMIGGLVVIISLLVIRLSADGPSLPEDFALPPGISAEAITFGKGWVAVVSEDQRLIILDAETGEIRKEVDLRN